MGYEIILVIGKSGHSHEEPVRDMDKPYSDGSGFAQKVDEKGQRLWTGRNMVWFNRMALIDLCKLGYEEDEINKLVNASFDKGKSDNKNCYFFYDFDGNQMITEDRYGAKMYPVPVAEVLAALKSSHPIGSYQRTDWAIAMLEAMATDTDRLEVMFYGH